MIRVPAAADVLELLALLANHGNFRVRGMALEEAIDIDATEALSECNVILLGELLLMKDQQAVGGEGRLQGVELIGVYSPQIYSTHIRTCG